jgi:hypothetical protein
MVATSASKLDAAVTIIKSVFTTALAFVVI